MRMKYVMITRNTLETPFVFPETESHNNVARALTHGDLSNVISAGFCDCYKDEINDVMSWTCFGESTTLKLVSRGMADAIIFDRMFRVQY